MHMQVGEETASALEEITSTVINNANNVVQMVNIQMKLVLLLKRSKLAREYNKCTMDEIKKQVNQ